MPINTADLRRSACGAAGVYMLPVPDAAITPPDRQDAAGIYRGILVQTVADVSGRNTRGTLARRAKGSAKLVYS